MGAALAPAECSDVPVSGMATYKPASMQAGAQPDGLWMAERFCGCVDDLKGAGEVVVAGGSSRHEKVAHHGTYRLTPD